MKKKNSQFQIMISYMQGDSGLVGSEAATGSVLKKFRACNFIYKRLQHRYFSVKFAEFLRTPILKNSCERLLLNLRKCSE